MSCNYAEGLSEYADKGVLGVPERFDDAKAIDEKVDILMQWVKEAKHVVVHTGAGISTSAGIPDFRGPNGVWTLESKGEKPSINISFDDAIPTKTHMSLTELANSGAIKYIVSQNIDGLHLRSGVKREFLSELHGNMFVDQCSTCHRQFVRQSATSSVGEKCLEIPCLGTRGSGRHCRGKLHDTILDWEANLPEQDLFMAEYHSTLADLNICLGTTLQIVPSGNLPLLSKKYGGRVVIVNLQPTKHDRKADLIINTYVDEVMSKLMKHLSIEIPEYEKSIDPTKTQGEGMNRKIIEWTINKKELSNWRKRYNEKCKEKALKRKSKDSEPKRENKKTYAKIEHVSNKLLKRVKVEVKEEIKEEEEDEMKSESPILEKDKIEPELKEDCLESMKKEFNKDDDVGEQLDIDILQDETVASQVNS